MNNKKRKTNCLNCEHSYRDESRTLRCRKGIMTSVTNYDCESYIVFLEDKEDLYKMYKVVENLKTSHNNDFKKDCYMFMEKKGLKLEFEQWLDKQKYKRNNPS